MALLPVIKKKKRGGEQKIESLNNGPVIQGGFASWRAGEAGDFLKSSAGMIDPVFSCNIRLNNAWEK